MTRTEKYELDRLLIELECVVADLENYCNIRKVFDDMLGNPINYLQELMSIPLYEEKTNGNQC